MDISKNETIYNECTMKVAQHYAAKIMIKQPRASIQEIDAAVQANWSAISSEIDALYIKVLEII